MRIDSGIFVRRTIEPTTIHVREHARGAWCVTVDDETRPLSLHPRREDAVALALALSRRGAKVIEHASEPVRAAG
jgi:hypothetical protein